MRFVDPFSVPLSRLMVGSGEIGLCGRFDPEEWVTVNVKSHTEMCFDERYGKMPRPGDAGNETD